MTYNVPSTVSLHKELLSYEKELLKQQERIEKLKESQADEADIRKQVPLQVG